MIRWLASALADRYIVHLHTRALARAEAAEDDVAILRDRLRSANAKCNVLRRNIIDAARDTDAQLVRVRDENTVLTAAVTATREINEQLEAALDAITSDRAAADQLAAMTPARAASTQAAHEAALRRANPASIGGVL